MRLFSLSVLRLGMAFPDRKSVIKPQLRSITLGAI